MFSDEVADRMTDRMDEESQNYIDQFFPADIWSTTTRNHVRNAFVNGGTSAIHSFIKELENGRK